MKENINFEAENWNTAREHTLCSLSIKIDILPSFKYIFSYVKSSESAKRCKTLTWYEFPLYLLLIFCTVRKNEYFFRFSPVFSIASDIPNWCLNENQRNDFPDYTSSLTRTHAPISIRPFAYEYLRNKYSQSYISSRDMKRRKIYDFLWWKTVFVWRLGWLVRMLLPEMAGV